MGLIEDALFQGRSIVRSIPKWVSAVSRLDRAATEWTVVQQAASRDSQQAAAARRSLVLRYSRAIHQYVTALVSDSQAADDLAQEVVVKLLKGDFSGADPNRGRFRDMLRTAVRNVVRNYWARQKQRAAVALDLNWLADKASEPNDPFLAAYRENLLRATWHRLQQYEAQQKVSGSLPYLVLQLRAAHPEATSDELAERLSEQLGRKVTPAAFRQQLHRARERFAEVLVQEIASALDQPDEQKIADELMALELYEYVREFLPSQAGASQ